MKIENYLTTLTSIPIVKQNNYLREKFNNLNKKLKNKVFQIVVLGQFKRGKTSLINALLGKDLLPTAIIPLTSIITILTYGRKEKITVSFFDNQEKQIKSTHLQNYITESKNPKNKKGVKQVLIEYPSGFLQNGIQIIDTPGVGSIYKHNTDIAYDFVPQADAGIFVVTVDPPISDSELQFLKSIKDYLAKIIFVQNKIDQAEKEDMWESSEFTKKIIAQTAGKKDLQFFQVSAKLALAGKKENNQQKIKISRIENLETAINRLFLVKKENFLSLSIARKLLALIIEIELQLKIEKKALQMSLVDLKNKVKIFKTEAEKINQEKEDNGFILQGQAERLINRVLTEDIENLKEKKLPKLIELFDKFFQEKKDLNGQEFKKQFDIFLEKTIKNIFIVWRKKEEAKLQLSLKTIIERFSDQTNQYIKKVVDLSINLFNLNLKSFSANSSLAEETEFNFSFDEYKVSIDLYTPLIINLPKFISHKLLYQKMKSSVLQQFDCHCGRCRYDFQERITKKINGYIIKLNETLNQTIFGIEKTLSKALSEKEKKETIQNKIRAVINNQEQNIAEIKNKIEKIINVAT